MFPHTNKMVFYWQRSHHEVVSMVTDAWTVCQTVRGSLVTGWNLSSDLLQTEEPAHATDSSLGLAWMWCAAAEGLSSSFSPHLSPTFCRLSPHLGPSNLRERMPLPLCLQSCISADAGDQTHGGDGVDLAISWKAGREPESPLARAQGSIRAAPWISQVSLLLWPQRAETIPRQTRWCSDEVTPQYTLWTWFSPVTLNLNLN